MKNIILIGGMPTAGKSTIAKLLSNQYDLPWFSTDQMRHIARSAASSQELPALFQSCNYSAEEYLRKFSPQEIADMEYEQGVQLWPITSSFIQNDSTWRDGFILEGVNILPHLFNRDFSAQPNTKAIFFV
jgi:2-phosphoglycerate kinase